MSPSLQLLQKSLISDLIAKGQSCPTSSGSGHETNPGRLETNPGSRLINGNRELSLTVSETNPGSSARH